MNNIKEIDQFELMMLVTKELALAKNSAKHDWHTFNLATISSDNFPSTRLMVLRDHLPEECAIVTNTDIRSPKIEAIRQNPNVAILFYDYKNNIQLRLKCNAQINYKNEFTLNSWNNLKKFSQRCYFHKSPPSSIVDIDYKEDFSGEGYENFCVLKMNYSTIEILQLNCNGHIRRKMFFDNNSLINALYLAP